jgi:phospholipid N-methyltransferase
MAVLHGLKFLRQSFQHGTTVGAVWPSSKGLCEAMVRPVFETPSRGPLRVLEVGAGVGPVTAELTERLMPGDHLDVVELNPAFCETLRQRFVGAPIPPHIHNENILEFAPGILYHHIVSGLPLANFPVEVSEAMYKRFFSLLEPGGTLVMFHHILGRQVIRAFGGPKDRRRARQLMELEATLEPLVVGSRAVMLNVPPARVLVRRRPPELEDRRAS